MKLLGWDLNKVTINQFIENYANQGLILTVDRIQMQMNQVSQVSQSGVFTK